VGSVNDIAKELNRLAKKHRGNLTPEVVLEAAKDPASPLHSRFEWDDDVAAHKWRLEQARVLLRQTVFLVQIGETIIPLPSFVRDPDRPKGEQGYISTIKAKSDSELAHGVLVDEFRRAADALARAKRLSSFFGMQDQVEKVERQIHRLQEAAQQHAAF
jgi:hypothetical protein